MGQTYTRSDISGSSGDFSNQNIVWYAVGVYTMMQRKLDDPGGGISGPFTAMPSAKKNLKPKPPAFWFQIDAPPNVPTAPIPGDTSMWDQCQHGTWYFPPWHRGYLMALEAQLRADIMPCSEPATASSCPTGIILM